MDADWLLLPYVGRRKELQGAAAALLCNSRAAVVARNSRMRESTASAMMKLVVCGQLPGVGKTVFGWPLNRTLAGALGKKVHNVYERHYCLCDGDAPEKSGSDRFAVVLCSIFTCRLLFHGLEEHWRSLLLRELLSEVEAFVHERDEFMLLHLDEFFIDCDLVPKCHPLPVFGINKFYCFWEHCLLPILHCPRIFLYISGRSLVFNEIGNGVRSGVSPTNVHPLLLVGFDENHLMTSLPKIFVQNQNRSGSVALPSILFPHEVDPTPSHELFAAAVCHCAGGVPRYCQFLVRKALQRQLQENPLPAAELIAEVSAKSLCNDHSVAISSRHSIYQVSYLEGPPVSETNRRRLFWSAFHVLLGCIATDANVFYPSNSETKATLPPDASALFEVAAQLSVFYRRIDANFVRFFLPPILWYQYSDGLMTARKNQFGWKSASEIAKYWSTLVEPWENMTGPIFGQLVSKSLFLDSIMPSLCYDIRASVVATTSLFYYRLKSEVENLALHNEFSDGSYLQSTRDRIAPLSLQSRCGNLSRIDWGAFSGPAHQQRLLPILQYTRK